MKIADYSQRVTVDQLDAALRAGGFEAVFHYLAGTPGFALRIEDPGVVAGIRDRGWPQLGIDIPRSPGDVNGAATASRVRSTYGFAGPLEVYLDIEPAQFDLAPAGWPPAADRWCDDIRAAGLPPGVYGVDRTLAVCADHADTIWRAKPGMCDPAGPGLADAFFAGRRAVQCGSGQWGGVEFDVNFSQFTVGGGQVAVGFSSRDEAVAFVDFLYGALLHREPATAADRDNWAAIALEQGMQALVDQFVNNPDVVAEQAVVSGLIADYKAGKLGGAAPASLPPHTHQVTVTGTSGQPQ